MVLEKEKREQIELDGKDAHFFLAFSLYNTDGIDRILPDGTAKRATRGRDEDGLLDVDGAGTLA